MTQLEQAFSYIERDLRMMSKDQYGGFENAIYVDKMIEDIAKIPHFCTNVLASINGFAYIAKAMNGPSGDKLIKLFNISLRDSRFELVRVLEEATQLKNSSKKNDRNAFEYLRKLYKLSVKQIISICANIKSSKNVYKNTFTELPDLLKHKAKYKMKFNSYNRPFVDFDDEDDNVDDSYEPVVDEINDAINKISSIIGRELTDAEKMRFVKNLTDMPSIDIDDDEDDDEDLEDKLLEREALQYLAAQAHEASAMARAEQTPETFEDFVKANNIHGFADEVPVNHAVPRSGPIELDTGDNFETFNTREPEVEEPIQETPAVDAMKNVTSPILPKSASYEADDDETNDTANEALTDVATMSDELIAVPSTSPVEEVEEVEPIPEEEAPKEKVENLYGVDPDQIHDPDLRRMLGLDSDVPTKEYLEEKEIVDTVRQFGKFLNDIKNAPVEKDLTKDNGIKRFLVKDAIPDYEDNDTTDDDENEDEEIKEKPARTLPHSGANTINEDDEEEIDDDDDDTDDDDDDMNVQVVSESEDSDDDSFSITDDDVCEAEIDRVYPEAAQFKEYYDSLMALEFPETIDKLKKFFAEENAVEVTDIKITMIPSPKPDKVFTLCVDVHVIGNNEVSDNFGLYNCTLYARRQISRATDIDEDLIDTEVNTFINGKTFDYDLAEFYEGSRFASPEHREDLNVKAIHMRNVYVCAILAFFISKRDNNEYKFKPEDLKITYTFLSNHEDVMVYYNNNDQMPEKLHAFLKDLIRKSKCADDGLIFCLNPVAIEAYRHIICKTIEGASSAIRSVLQASGEFLQDFIAEIYRNPTELKILYDVNPKRDDSNILITYNVTVDNPLEEYDIYDIREEFEHHGLIAHNLRTATRLISPWVTPKAVLNIKVAEPEVEEPAENSDTNSTDSTNAFNLNN